ncbi:MAG: hypothetical protein ACYCUD_09065 [Candidatus Dormibacteria bacterium]
MLSLTTLPLLVLLPPAIAAFLAGASSRSLVPNPGLVASWTVRLGLTLSLVAAAAILVRLPPTGIVDLTLWRLDSELPVTLQFGVGGLGLAAMVLAAALVVSFSAGDRRPLVSSALAVAALGGVLAAMAGGLLSLFVGLQLSAVGGIGISYARSPRAASRRVVWAAVADQAVALVWLGAVVALYHSAGTVQFSDIPTGSINFVLAVILLVPALVRLSSAGLLLWSVPGAEGARALDLADWLSVVAVPTSLVILLRDLQLSGGVWPSPAFGTMLDAVGLTAALAIAVVVLVRRRPGGEVGALLVVAAALTFLGFGSNSPAGTELGVGAGLFLELLAAFLPRSLATTTQGLRSLTQRGQWASVALRVVIVAAGSPVSLAFTASLLGLGLGLQAGGLAGLMPTLGYGGCLFCLCLLFPLLLRLRGGGYSWRSSFLLLPGGLVVAGAIAGGWILTGPVAAIAFSGAAVPAPITSPDPLSVQIPGILYPQGYVALLALLLLLALGAVRYAAGATVWPRWDYSASLDGTAEAMPAPFRVNLDLSRWMRRLGRVGRAVILGLDLSERELAERPVWLWLATTFAVAWLMAQR